MSLGLFIQIYKTWFVLDLSKENLNRRAQGRGNDLVGEEVVKGYVVIYDVCGEYVCWELEGQSG